MASSTMLPRGAPFRVLLDSDWSHGMVGDAPRDAIPEGALYDSADFLLHQPNVAIKRGGTSYAGPALTSATYGAAVTYVDFPAGGKLVGIGDNGHLYTITSGTTTDVSTLGTGFPPVAKPVYTVDQSTSNLLVIPASNGTTAPKKYDGTTVANLGGSPPAGKYAAMYKSHLVLASQSATPNRLYFGPTAAPENTWDTTGSWLDTDYPVTGIASLQNALLVFSSRGTERITGSTPPSQGSTLAGSDFSRSPVGATGCTDARSITVYEGAAIFANPRGIYLTNGSGFRSLTRDGGIEAYWISWMSGYVASTWTITTGILRQFLFVTVLNASGTLVVTLMCNLARMSWWRLTNVKAMMYAPAHGVSDELYYADRGTNRVVALSGIFAPTSANKNDADGTAVAPFLETRMLGSGEHLKHYAFAYVGLDMRDSASDNPTMAVTVAPGMEATTYAAVAQSPLAESSDAARYRVTVAQRAQGVSFRFTQTGASSKTELYSLAVQERPFPPQEGGVS